MKRPPIVIVLSLAVLWPPSSPYAAVFIATTDGNTIPCPVIGMIWHGAVAETSLAITQLKSTDPESGRLRADRSTQSTGASRVKGDLPKVDESLSGTEYVNRTGKFALTTPRKSSRNCELFRRICHGIYQALGTQFRKNHRLVSGAFVSRHAAFIGKARNLIPEFQPIHWQQYCRER